MIAMGRARRPPRSFGGERFAHVIPSIVDVLIYRLMETNQAGLVTHQLAYGDGVLTVGREFRPVTRNRIVESNRSIGDGLQNTDGSHGFGDREHATERVLHPFPLAATVDVARP